MIKIISGAIFGASMVLVVLLARHYESMPIPGYQPTTIAAHEEGAPGAARDIYTLPTSIDREVGAAIPLTGPQGMFNMLANGVDPNRNFVPIKVNEAGEVVCAK